MVSLIPLVIYFNKLCTSIPCEFYTTMYWLMLTVFISSHWIITFQYASSHLVHFHGVVHTVKLFNRLGPDTVGCPAQNNRMMMYTIFTPKDIYPNIHTSQLLLKVVYILLNSKNFKFWKIAAFMFPRFLTWLNLDWGKGGYQLKTLKKII